MTFEDKLNRMRWDLASIVARMNKDRSHDVASLAQAALASVATLQDQMEEHGTDEFDWKWKPDHLE